MGERPEGLCSPTPYLSTTVRTKFGTLGCTVYGWQSTGGVLIKSANLLDMLFLSLPRNHTSQRSPSADEEDRFCNPSREDEIEVHFGIRDITEEEAKVLVLGWPVDGVGVWVLRFRGEGQLPRYFGRLSLAMDMEEKIEMREYGAVFVEDAAQVEELL
ncbi:hypothetical protein DL98DRAFT_548487 [Cadophora sp. DSE1049]|nr:hypothetical protein DL98DRAFT_548487 [Cadophora sp. DSE1049]